MYIQQIFDFMNTSEQVCKIRLLRLSAGIINKNVYLLYLEQMKVCESDWANQGQELRSETAARPAVRLTRVGEMSR